MGFGDPHHQSPLRITNQKTKPNYYNKNSELFDVLTWFWRRVTGIKAFLGKNYFFFAKKRFLMTILGIKHTK